MKRNWTPFLSMLLTLSMTVGLFAPSASALAAESPGTSPAAYEAASLDYSGERKLEFNEDWKFVLSDVEDGQSMSLNDSGWKQVSLPHDWSIYEPYTQSVAPNAGSLPGGTGWYRKSFVAPAELADKKVSIQFDGVYMVSDVYINEHHLGTQYLGYTTFQYDISAYLKPGENNVIAVKVVSKTPNSRFYAGAGIYRNVWLNVTETLHVSDNGVYITTPKEGISEESGLVKVQTELSNDTAVPATVTLKSTVYQKDGDVASVETKDLAVPASGTLKVDQTVSVPDPKLWSVDSPNLYYMRTEILSGGEVVDTLDTRFGIRYIEMIAGDNDQNGKLRQGFYLNGERVQLQGVCMHSDLGSLGMEVNQAAIDRQLRILKSFGTNAIRGAHNPVSPEFVEACDRLGILLQEEAFDMWEDSKNPNDYSNYYRENHQRDIEAMVQRDKNAPSIIMWSIGNEINESHSDKGLTMGKELMDYIKAIDDSRIVTAAVPTWAGYYESTQQHLNMLDMAGFNYQESRYEEFHNRFPNKVIYGAETVSSQYSRGIYFQSGDARQDGQCNAYGGSWNFNSPEYSLQMVRDRPYVAGEFVWTGFDFIGEPNPYGWPSKSSYWGIVDTCGFPKDVYYLYKSVWQPEVPTVHIVPENWNHQLGDEIRILIHTNAASVELFLNGESLGVKNHDINKYDGPVNLEWGKIAFAPGELKAVARDKDGNVIATDAVYTAGDPASIALSPDRTMIKADGKDLVFVEATIVDSKGNMCPDADNRIYFEATGGEIVSVDNGNAVDHDPYRSDNRRAFSGKALVLVKAEDAGDITITARASTDSGGIGSNTVAVKAVNGFTEDADKIVSMVESSVVVEKGSSAAAIDLLPKTVEIVYGNGVIERSTVTWTIPSDISFDTLISYRIEGTVEGVAQKAICVLAVKEIESAEAINVMTYAGAAPMLPTFVPVTYTDDTTGAADVVWDEIDPEDYAHSGTFTVSGKLAANSAIAATAKVTVKSIESYDEIAVMTTVGVLPTMPSTVTITLDDKTEETVTVWWGVSEADVQYSGTTQVFGTIAGTTSTVSAALTVMLDRYVSDLAWASAKQDGVPGKRVSVDKAITGDDLKSRNPQGGPPRTHEKGLGTAANSEIVYDITGKGYERFQAYCSLHFVTQEDKGRITFKVFLDDETTPAYDSGVMSYASERDFIDVDIAGASKIRLVTESAGSGSKALDLGNWCDAKFLSEHIAVSDIVDDNYLAITEIGRIPGLPASVSARTEDGTTARFRVKWDVGEDTVGTAGGKVVQGEIVGTAGARMTANIIVDFDAVVQDPSLSADITKYQRTDKFENETASGKTPMTKELLGNDTLISDFSSNMLLEVVNNYSLENVIYPAEAPGYVVYRGLDIKSFELRSAARDDGSERFVISTSSDGESFTPFTDYTVIDSPPGDWNPKLHSSGPLPANTNYIKIEFPKALDWRFNLNRVTLSGGTTAMVTGITVPKNELIVGFTGEIETYVNTANTTDETVTVQLLDADGKVLGQAEADDAGKAVIKVDTPMPAGEYQVLATLAGEQNGKSTTLTVTNVLPRDGWTATAYTYTELYEAGKPDKAIDNDLKSRWADGNQQDGTPGRWFQVDMGKDQNIEAISIDAGSSTDDYGRKYDVYTRPDGSTEKDWQLVRSAVEIDSTYQMITFPGHAARYIRVEQTGSTTVGCWWSIYDINIYGCVPVEVDLYSVDVPDADNGAVTADPTSAEEGETVVLTIAPADGYELDTISAHSKSDGTAVVELSGTGATRTFSMPAFDVVVSVRFKLTEAPPVKTPLAGTLDISGDAVFGQVLAADASAVTPQGATYTYMWTRAGEETSIGDASSYTSVEADVGKVLTLTITGTGDYTGKLTAATAVVAKAAKTMPTGVSAADCTTGENNDGVISGVDATMEYSVKGANDWVSVGETATTVTSLTPARYEVRYKETDTHLASPSAEVEVRANGALPREPKPTAEFDAADMLLTAVTDAMKYQVDDGGWTPIAGTSVDLSDAALAAGSVIKIYQPGNKETTADSEEQVIALTQAAAPSGVGKTDCTTEDDMDGAITGVDSTMEYREQDADSWTGVTGDAVTGLAPKTYEVRIKGAGTVLAGPSVTITILAYAPERYTVTFETNGGSTVASATVKDGETVAKPADPTRSGYDFAGWYTDDALTVAYDFERTVTADLTLYAKWEEQEEPHYAPPSNTTTKTEKNEDGSTTKTVTNKKTGEVVATTTYSDGTKIVATTPKDGATTIDVSIPKGTSKVTVTVPATEQPKAGDVAVIVKEDGKREVVKTSVATESGMRVTLDESCTLELVDNSKTFADVAEDHWAADAVQFAASRELFGGTGKDTFAPAVDMSRAMLVTVLARLEGVDIEGGDTWYAKAADWAKEEGITDGTALDVSITRESLVVMLYRYAGSPDIDEERRVKDAAPYGEYEDADTVSDWAKDAMAWAVDAGILTGKSGDLLDPRGTATRAEVAAMFQRFISQ